MSLSVELLDSKKHDRTTFQCGVNSLDDYIKTRASQELKKKVSTPFVLTDSPERQVMGYYCLSSYSIAFADIEVSASKKLPRYPLLPAILLGRADIEVSASKKLPRYPLLPAILLGRLAIDSGQQRKGYGDLLVVDALKRSLNLSKQLASYAVVVDAISQDAVRFYRRYGFVEFPDEPMKLYLAMDEIEESK